MDKRLQFIHHNEIFSGNTTVEAREAAISFLTNQYFKQVTRPSLYAEPVIVRYESKETPNEPNIILAIGSKGSGSTLPTKDSEYFLIDAQGIKDDVNEKYDDIERAIAKLAFKVIDSDTLHLSKENTEAGSIVSGDVKISDNIVINKEFVNNIIKKNEDGIYSYVHLDFDDKTNTFTFQVNEDVNEFSIPVIESGKYDISKECIVLTYTDGKTLDIDVDDLIGEWDTEGESSTTPIVLTKEKHTDKNTDINDRNHDHWRDILKADIRIADTKKHNILTKVNDGRELYVKGTADNIAYDDKKNVKQAIDAITTEISTAMTNNIIYKDYANNGDYQGIAANVKLDYDKTTNILTFSISDTNGVMHAETHKLNSASFIDDISYNTEKQTITIRYKDEDGNVQKTDIDLSTLLDDWEVSSEAHNVKLNKQSNPGKKDILTADAKIKAKTDDNYQILEDRDHELYVKGTADNIHYKNGEYVDKALDRTEKEITDEATTRLDSDTALSGHVTTIYNTIGKNVFSTDENKTISHKFTELDNKVSDEIERSTNADKTISGAVDIVSATVHTINDTIGTGAFSTDSHETISYKFNSLSAKTDNEINRSVSVDAALSGDIKSNKANIEALSAESYFEVGETKSVLMHKDSQTSAHTVTADVKIDKDKPNNILVINPDNNNGLFATISYDEATNELIVSDTSGSTHERRISLKTDKIIKSAKYDKDTEEIVIEFDTKNIEDSELRIKVGDIIKEWETDNVNHNITLTRSEHDVAGTDKLTADVNIPTTDNYADNIIQNVSLVNDSKKGIYVSGENVRQSATTIADKAATKAKDDAINSAKTYTDDVHNIITGEIRTAKEEAKNSASAYTDTAIAQYNHTIHDELRDLSADTVDLVNSESRRALSAETALSTRINSEADTRHNEDEKLSNSITSATQDLTTKIGNVKDLVTGETNDRQDADRTLQTHIDNEQSARIAKDLELSQSISGEAISREIAVNAEKSTREQEDTRLANLISAEASNRERQDTALDNKITAETAARTADTKSLTDNLATEIANAKKYAVDQDKSLKTEVEKYADDKDSALKTEVEKYANDAVAAVTLTGGSTATAEVTVADKTIKANVLLSTASDNILRSGEGTNTGLYAKPGQLSYESATNKLTFKDENGKDTVITLNSASFIDSISYDESGRTLDITYHVAGQGEGTTQTVKVNLAGLVNKQTVDNTDKTVNIETAATIDNGVSVTQFSAMVNIADNISDNLIETVKDGGKGALVVHGKPIYDKISEVSGSSKDNTDKITKIIEAVGLNSDGTKKGKGDNIQKELDDAQKAAGLTEDGKYTANTDTTYITNVTSLTKADEALDKAIKDVSDKFSSYSASSSDKSANLQAELDAAEKAAFGDVPFTSASTYTVHENSNYIGKANSLTDADNILDINLHKVSGDVTTIINKLDGDEGLTDKLEKLRRTVGANADYSYQKNTQSPYINDAENLNDADVKLANAVRTVSGDITNIKIDITNITDPTSGTIKNLQDEINRIEYGSGLDNDGNYIKSDKKYISSANTLAEADKALSDAISNVEGKLNNLTKGGETYTAILSAETDVNTGVDLLKANVRLSQASGQDVNELTRTAIPHSSDYESNLLQVVKAVSEGEQITLDSSVNGLYFGGSIDYGELQGDDTLGD